MRHNTLAIAAAALLFAASQLPVSTSALAAPQGQQGVVGGGAADQGAPPAGGRQGGRQGGRGGGGRGRQAGPPPGPAPRNADGRVLLGGATSKETGLWTPRGVSIFDPLTPADQVPFQPWARAVYLAREEHELEPHTRCKASGVARQFMTPYGVEFVELPELQRIYIFDVGGPHTYRTVYMDGRSHPTPLVPTYYGHSIGWWEGDTLVIDSTGFNEDFWLDRRGLPHTEALHTIERFTRTDANTIRYEVTIDDPGAYTAPWNGTFQLGFARGQELFEYICQQANQASELMVGDLESIDRSSSIIP
jgi:hypothetical protein